MSHVTRTNMSHNESCHEHMSGEWNMNENELLKYLNSYHSYEFISFVNLSHMNMTCVHVWTCLIWICVCVCEHVSYEICEHVSYEYEMSSFVNNCVFKIKSYKKRNGIFFYEICACVNMSHMNMRCLHFHFHSSEVCSWHDSFSFIWNMFLTWLNMRHVHVWTCLIWKWDVFIWGQLCLWNKII